jgi:hypothetical protein
MTGLSMPDAIALFGVCGMITTALVKFVPSKKVQPNGNISKAICEEKHRNINDRLTSIDQKLQSIDEFLRGN